MSHFAKVKNGFVLEVIVAEQDFVDTIPQEEGVSWVQTSYNTYGGVHSGGKEPLRKNYAGPGYMYDADRDAFIPPQKYPSWTLNESTCLWEPPEEYPDDDKDYEWDERLLSWVEMGNPESQE